MDNAVLLKKISEATQRKVARRGSAGAMCSNKIDCLDPRHPAERPKGLCGDLLTQVKALWPDILSFKDPEKGAANSLARPVGVAAVTGPFVREADRLRLSLFLGVDRCSSCCHSLSSLPCWSSSRCFSGSSCLPASLNCT